ncbi:amino acid ABC transporter permease [Pseudovibrio sp. SPO723]|uniref:amino acid ABC transporter permease n=1 Tax=Nesiotobacter zosterae TaxID=392721 RepID=UPI0029C5788A|nr:amino acid ABC transporter permease [Pseudovibrio sp. SPO723]MDX5592641.1 amino acid ABC transporter permease [Pseudovibrio sp. SPO723]
MTKDSSIAFVLKKPKEAEPAPIATTGALAWTRENLFSSRLNTALTILSLLFLAWMIPGLVQWTFVDAVWFANSIDECRQLSPGGACWAVITARFDQFMFGFYPEELRWRPVLAFILLGVALLPVLWDAVPARKQLFFFSAIYPLVAFALLWGDGFIFERVNSSDFGGFLLTMIIGVTGISFSLPIGVLLALGRNSNLPFIKLICVTFIEFIRGVPLITLLFVASTLLNYLLPPGTNFDIILRVLIMVTLFASAYMAEVIRGGLAALSKGQYEAADALGLTYWQSMYLIILPQALKISIPGIVNTFIGLFKDTTLVSVIGLLDPLGIIQPILADSTWNGLVVELYAFVGLVFFVFCFAMSRYSMYLERKLSAGDRH